MTVNAVIALSRPNGQIPVSGHATVSSMLVVTKLRAVALSTKLHGRRVLNGRPICKMQSCVAVLRIMA